MQRIADMDSPQLPVIELDSYDTSHILWIMLREVIEFLEDGANKDLDKEFLKKHGLSRKDMDRIHQEVPLMFWFAAHAIFRYGYPKEFRWVSTDLKKLMQTRMEHVYEDKEFRGYEWRLKSNMKLPAKGADILKDKMLLAGAKHAAKRVFPRPKNKDDYVRQIAYAGAFLQNEFEYIYDNLHEYAPALSQKNQVSLSENIE
jgi:hypothetical protein